MSPPTAAASAPESSSPEPTEPGDTDELFDVVGQAPDVVWSGERGLVSVVETEVPGATSNETVSFVSPRGEVADTIDTSDLVPLNAYGTQPDRFVIAETATTTEIAGIVESSQEAQGVNVAKCVAHLRIYQVGAGWLNDVKLGTFKGKCPSEHWGLGAAYLVGLTVDGRYALAYLPPMPGSKQKQVLVRVSDQKILWTTTDSALLNVAGKYLFSWSEDNTELRGVSPETGRRLWRSTRAAEGLYQGEINAWLDSGRTALIAHTDGARTYKLDFATGRYVALNGIRGVVDLALPDQDVGIVAGTKLTAFSLSKGTKLWSVAVSGTPCTGDSDHLAVSANSQLAVLDLHTGQQLDYTSEYSDCGFTAAGYSAQPDGTVIRVLP